mmetsp:Transcript_92666/g.164758  ORF Transcript_92666/g.164758 Transcript_92666/m.164758 type:complete len:124 (-) Transcript_92666:559-930(-)
MIRSQRSESSNWHLGIGTCADPFRNSGLLTVRIPANSRGRVQIRSPRWEADEYNRIAPSSSLLQREADAHPKSKLITLQQQEHTASFWHLLVPSQSVPEKRSHYPEVHRDNERSLVKTQRCLR